MIEIAQPARWAVRQDAAETIRLRRKEAGLSQADLGLRMGHPTLYAAQRAVSRIESGSAGLRVILQAASCLGLAPEDVLERVPCDC